MTRDAARSVPAESYLATIYLLGEEGTEPIQARLVDRLGHTAAAVSEMIGRLHDAGLLTGDRRHLTLTPAGLTVAETSIRRHRLAERLLTDIVGVDWTTAHREASRWEQAISDDVEKLLVDLLGNPTTSSLGTPIPGTATTRPPERALLNTTPGETVRITQLTEALQADLDTIHYLDDRGLRPGTTVTVDGATPDGTLTVTTPEAILAITPAVARQIAVVTALAHDERGGSPPPE